VTGTGEGIRERRLAFTRYASAKRPEPSSVEDIAWNDAVSLFLRRSTRKSKDGPGFSFVKLKPGSGRNNDNVEYLSAAVVDVDDGTPIAELMTALDGLEFVAMSSHNHRTSHPKYRIVLPLVRDVAPAEWPRVWAQVLQLVGSHGDKATKDVSRLYYLPSCPKEFEGEAFFRHNQGTWLDPDHIPAPSAQKRNDEMVSTSAKGTAPNMSGLLWRFSADAHAINARFIAGISVPPDPDLICFDGERTAQLKSLLGSWLAQGYTLEQIREIAHEWNRTKCVPPRDEWKVDSLCDNMWKKHERGQKVDLKQGADVNPVTSLGTPLAPIAGVAPIGSVIAPAVLCPLESASVGRWLDNRPPAPRWLLNNCLPMGKVGAIIAPGGTGKSQFALQLLLSVATGLPLCDAWTVGETGGVLGLFAEDDDEELHRRFVRSVEQTKKLGPDANFDAALRERAYIRSMIAENNLLTRADSAGDVRMTEYVQLLIATAAQIQSLKLIVIDPASRFRGGKENLAEDTTRFVEALEHVSKQTSATVLVLHHANKSSMNAEEQNQGASRGSSAFTDGVRWQMNLAGFNKSDAKHFGIPEEEKYRYLSASITKSNYAPPRGPVYLLRGNEGYLSRTELRVAAENAKEDLMLRVMAKICDEPDRYSVNSFGSIYAGTDKEFQVGDHAIRAAFDMAFARGYLDKGGKRNLLSVTDKGADVLAIHALSPKGSAVEVSGGRQAGSAPQIEVPDNYCSKNKELCPAVGTASA